MSDVINTTIAVARVGIFLTNYTGYKFNKRIQDEASIRQWLMVKLDSAHQNSLKVLDISHSNSNTELSHIIKKLLDNIETFKNDSNLAASGTKGKFFTSDSVATVASLTQLIEFDAAILERTEKASQALISLSKAIMNKEEGILSAAIDISTAFLEIHNKFRERIKYIRGFGHK